MCFFKNKFEKLTRQDVVEAIINLENESAVIDKKLVESQSSIDEMMEKGKKEKSRDMKLYYAKRINALKEERQANIKRATYLMYNITLLNKLKNTIDDNDFFAKTSKINFNNLLADQKGLANFLNSALGNKVNAENVLTQASDIFDETNSLIEENQAIYGKNEKEDELLSIFELETEMEDTTVGTVDETMKNEK
ncbi:MAG: hypothetical protein ACI4MY_06525 [Christensenellales bacterium]